jgi:GT2 family glycosyltransferase
METIKSSADPKVTLVVVPRERFSFARESLESIYERTNFPFKLVYVSAGSPRALRRYLAAEAQVKGFELIHTNHYLTPNQARNLGLVKVTTKYVVFIDNDVLVTPGWLENLVRCAEETGAWIVGPLYLKGRPELQIVHLVGGTIRVEEKEGRRIFHDGHRLRKKTLPEVAGRLHREACDYLEFHCMMLRTEVFERLGPLDEKFLNTHEHIDLCMAVRQAGGSIYVEPKSAVAYVPPPPFAWSDARFFMLRWSEKWSLASLRHFEEKWGMVDLNDLNWLRTQRRRLYKPLLGRLLQLGPFTGSIRAVLRPVEIALNRFLVRDGGSKTGMEKSERFSSGTVDEEKKI